MSNDWQPWKDAMPGEETVFIAELPIEGPPCGGCKFWAPRRWYGDATYYGVICCHAKDMERDFSCYVPRVGKAKDDNQKETP